MASFSPSLVYFLFVLTISSFSFACTSSETPVSMVKVLDCPPKESSTQYKNISLQNYTYTRGQMMFNPQNIRLGGQYIVPPLRPTPKSSKGLHLHVSVDNQQHELSNNNIFDYPLEDGHYHLFAFLADAYYESIKEPNAIVGKYIKINKGNLAASRPIEQVALLYNIPIGEHEVTEKDSILLDFVLYGTELEEQGNYVTLIINEQEPVRLEKWQPYYLIGFTEGQHQLVLTLHNAQGKAIAPPVKNIFTVKSPTKSSK